MVMRNAPEIASRGYSSEELEALYSLGRHYLEIGKFFSAKNIFVGLTVISPEFVKGWQGLAVTTMLSANVNEASSVIRQLLRVEPTSLLAQLLLVNVQIMQKDFNSAGTALGEISDMLDSGSTASHNLVKIYKALLLRFEHKR